MVVEPLSVCALTEDDLRTCRFGRGAKRLTQSSTDGSEMGLVLSNGQSVRISTRQQRPPAIPGKLDDVTGIIIWPGALRLLHYCSEHPELFSGARVLELGAGLGLLGISAGLLGAARIVLTDLHGALPTLHANVLVNSVGAVAHVAELEWGAGSACLEEPFDLILAADCVYDDGGTSEKLLATVRQHAGASTVFLLCGMIGTTAIRACTEGLRRNFGSVELLTHSLNVETPRPRGSDGTRDQTIYCCSAPLARTSSAIA